MSGEVALFIDLENITTSMWNQYRQAIDPVVLTEWRARIDRYLEGRRLKLHPRKTVILPTSEPSAFLGFELHAGPRKHGGSKAGRGSRRLPEDNVARFRGRLRSLRDQWRTGTATKADIAARISAWIAHAAHADTFWLRQAVFEDGWFEPTPGFKMQSVASGSPEV